MKYMYKYLFVIHRYLYLNLRYLYLHLGLSTWRISVTMQPGNDAAQDFDSFLEQKSEFRVRINLSPSDKTNLDNLAKLQQTWIIWQNSNKLG